MVSERDDIILQYGELKRKFGDTALFKQFEEKYSHDIDFLKFQKENKLHYSKKNGWNKPFIPKSKMMWVPDKKNYNKEYKKYGYFVNVHTGYQLTEKPTDKKCKWCGRLLTGRHLSSCCDLHKTYLHRVLKRGLVACSLEKF